jgi:DNA-binding response OmpR family regulator
MMVDTVEVVIVEKDAGIRAHLRQMLEQDGYQVTEASDGDTALALLRKRASRAEQQPHANVWR